MKYKIFRKVDISCNAGWIIISRNEMIQGISCAICNVAYTLKIYNRDILPVNAKSICHYKLYTFAILL